MVRLTAQCPEALRAVVNGPLLEQALINLIVNAIKNSPAHSTVKVEGAEVHGEIRLIVSDSGAGIDRKHLPRLFERFYRVDKGRSRNEGGTGLGLAIVKHIAHAHGGYATVESEVGIGSVFAIHINPS